MEESEQKANARQMARDLSTDCGKGFVVGEEVYFAPLHVGGNYISFRPDATRFLYGLMQTKGDIAAAAARAQWTPDRASRFLISKKWRTYRELLLAQAAVRNGDLRDFWWTFMLDGAKGYTEHFRGTCQACHEEYDLPPQVAEQYRDDDMKLRFECHVCKQPVALEQIQEEFKPSREQVQCAVEIGSRVEPKIERVHHEFSNETYVFAPESGQE